MNIEFDAVLSEIIEDHDGFNDSYEFDFSDYLEPVESGEWTQNGKCQYRQVIYYSKKHDVHVAVNEIRIGSYYNWEHMVPTVELVKLQERVVTQTIREWITL